jgi:hypothetical protein
MLGRSELAHWAARFGVPDDQIRRDHVITHILVSLAATEANDVVFYGRDGPRPDTPAPLPPLRRR